MSNTSDDSGCLCLILIFILLATTCNRINNLNLRIDTIEHYIELDKKWFDSIHNPINQPFLLEISTELDVHPDSVTQEQFYERYLKHE